MTDVQSRRVTLAARVVGLAGSLPEGDPLRVVGDATPTHRLKTTTGWREVGRAALAAAGAQDVPIEVRLHHTPAPWTEVDSVSVYFHLDLGPRARWSTPETVRRTAAEACLRELPEEGPGPGGDREGRTTTTTSPCCARWPRV